MSIDPGFIGPGLGLADPTGVTDTASGDPQTDFRTAVMQALLAHGVDLTRLGSDQIDNLINGLWNEPHLRDLFSLENDPSAAGFPDLVVSAANLRSAIEKDLFSPTESQSSGALSAGLGIMQSQNIPLSSSQADSLAAGGGTPRPFQGDYPVTLDYGQGFGSETEQGVDYGMPVGTGIYAPFSGVIRTEDGGKSNWGKRVFVYLDNGYVFAVGHMSSFNVQEGQRVKPGDLLGGSGGDPSDPSSGQSTGAHIEVQWISPDGQYLNPHPIIDPILAGNPSNADKIMASRYPTASSDFERTYGRKPYPRELQDLISRTGGNPAAITEYLRNQPSHIPGLTNGAYSDLRSIADRESNAVFGHSVTDGMLKELSDQGRMSPTAVKSWLMDMDIAGKMDPKTYQAIWGANQGHMQGVYNSKGFDPRIAHQQFQQAQAAGLTEHQIQSYRHHLQREGVTDSNQPSPTFHEGSSPLDQREGGGGSKMFS
jgi:murein DD-endopeptidase MepM/ murein hydrolase activator NlpD